jgi:phospholipase D1/2
MRDAVIHVNPLARKLRVDLWKKHLALAGGGNGIVQPARELEKLIEWPAAAQTIKAIQTLAKNNAALYNKAFGFVPWSDDREDRRSGASIWPTCPPLTEKERFTLAQDQQHKEKLERAQRFASKMPFHESFWQLRGGAAPAGIKGYFTRLPTYWTSGENNHPDPISAMLLTQHGSAETNVG